jgi:hypothetical protein
VVLLVYSGDVGDPVVVTAHSRDDRARVEVVRDITACPDLPRIEGVMAALAEAVLDGQAPALERTATHAG